MSQHEFTLTIKGRTPEELIAALKAAATAVSAEASQPTTEAETSTVAKVKAVPSSTPPTALVSLLEDGQLSQWLSQISAGTTSHKERKALVRHVRDLVVDCAAAQRSDSKEQLRQQVAAGVWLSVEKELPAPYEEVRLLVDGGVRIARLAHDKKYFQLASYMGSAKHQYAVSLDRVQGWQPLIGIPGLV